MLRPLALLLAALAVVAGCITTSAPPPAAPDAPSAGSTPWALDCGISAWADGCTALASPNPSPAKTEIDLAVNPLDPANVFVASKDLDEAASNCVWSVGQVTKDAGRSWATVYVGGTAEERALPTHPLFGWDCVTDPIMVFDAQGILYYPLQAYNLGPGDADCFPAPLGGLPVAGLVGCGSAFFLAVSRDGGATFPAGDILPMAAAEGGLVFHDYPRMVVNPATQTVSTVWNAVGSAGINPYVVNTRDQGRTVDLPVVVAHPDAPRGTAFASGYAAASDGTVYMTINVGGAPVPLLAISEDDARSFPTYRPMFDVVPIACPLPNTEFRCFTALELAADASGGAHDGRLHAVWADGRNGDADIYAAWTDDGGQAWSAPVRVNQDSTPNAQFMSRVEVAPDGTVHVLFMDRAYDPQDRLYDATWAWSTDGGLTWASQRITTIGSDGDLGVHQNDFPFIGDYAGVDSAGDHVWMGFPHTATGVAEIAMAHAVRAPPAGGEASA